MLLRLNSYVEYSVASTVTLHKSIGSVDVDVIYKSFDFSFLSKSVSKIWVKSHTRVVIQVPRRCGGKCENRKLVRRVVVIRKRRLNRRRSRKYKRGVSCDLYSFYGDVRVGFASSGDTSWSSNA